MDLLGDFHKMDAELQNSTTIEVGDLEVCICYDHFKNQDEKRIKVSLGWGISGTDYDISDTNLNKAEAETLIQSLQKLVKEL